MADTARSRPPLIEARGLSKSYGHVEAIVDVDITIAPDEAVALVGDNGAGKSTLAKVLSGAIRPDAGRIAIDGDEQRFANPMDARRAGISTVYQDLALANNLNVAENICLSDIPTRWGRVDKKRMQDEATRVLEELAVNMPRPNAPVSVLSGGQRQAVAIARGVRDGGRLMILDEPTAALGVQEGTKVLRLIEEIRSREMAFLIVSHNLDHVFALSDRIVVLRGGRVAGSRETSATTRQEIVGLIVGAEGTETADGA